MFEVGRLIVIIIGTLLCFGWIFRLSDIIAKCFILFFIITFLVYSGIGGALNGVSDKYISYYFVFSIFLSLGLYIGLKVHKNRYSTKSWDKWNQYFNYYIKYQANKIIGIFYLIKILDLIVPEFKLLNLIHPPSPDVLAMLDAKFNGSEETPIITTLLTFASQLVYPFFLLSLYRYRTKILKLSIIILGTYYISYCSSGYIGRGDMLEAVIIIFAFTYIFQPRLRKRIVIGSMIFLPLILIFLVQYSITRIGGEVSDIDAIEAAEILFSQEGGYPLHFAEILALTKHCTQNYLIWLFTMPLPGIFRGGIDANFNVIFSEQMLGMARGESGFFILLPGMIGESVFLLGKSFFWINGIIYGFIMGSTFKILRKYPQLFGVLVATIIDLCYVGNRGGIVSSLPFVLKILIYFYFILLILEKCYYKNRKYE